MFKLEGIMPPMLTPFTEDGRLDEESLRRETRYLLDAGVHGLTVCGSTGEGYALTPDEVGKVTAIVKDEAGTQIPVITGVIADSANIAVEIGMAAKNAGADGLMVTPVHYVFTPTDEGNIDYYRQIAVAVGLPIVIYNVIAWNVISVGLAVKLTEIENVRGIKQSGGDIHGLADMIRALGEKIPIMSAIDDMLLPSFVIGARGAIAAICTVAPELCIEIWEAVNGNDSMRGIGYHNRLLGLWRVIGKGGMPARAKEALRQLGRPVGPARSPMVPVSEEVKKQIRDAIREAKLIA